jgi:hypothetical protein
MAFNHDGGGGEDGNVPPPLIDPSLLAGLTDTERAEALAAAAAAFRAERRAEERARQRSSASAVGGGAAGDNVGEAADGDNNNDDDDDDEDDVVERRALAEALESRRKAREMDKFAEMERLRTATSTTAMGGYSPGIVGGIDGGWLEGGGVGPVGGLAYLGRDKRGACRISGGGRETTREDATALTSSKWVKTGNVQQQQQLQQQHRHDNHESHLTASQLAFIKKAYLGEKAYVADAAHNANGATGGGRSSNGGDPSSSQSAANNAQFVRKQLREQRQKRRVKKTTFKFEWEAEEDTFDDDDPLYGGNIADAVASSSSSKTTAPPSGSGSNNTNNNFYRPQQQYHHHEQQHRPQGGIGRPNNQQRPQMPNNDDGAVIFGRKKARFGYDSVATVHTVVTKPIEKMTPRDWRIYRENYNIVVKGGKSPPPMRSFREMPVGVPPIHPSLLDAIEKRLKYTDPSPIQRQAIPIGMQRRDMIGGFSSFLSPLDHMTDVCLFQILLAT